jgi:sigma-E factor negative regulatory protein RseC
LGRLLGDRLREIKVVSDRNDLQIGDQVVIGLGDTALLKASLVLYLMPLVLMFAMAALFSFAANTGGDLSSLVGAIIGLSAGLWLARRYGRGHDRDSLFHPRVLERTGRECPIADPERP